MRHRRREYGLVLSDEVLVDEREGKVIVVSGVFDFNVSKPHRNDAEPLLFRSAVKPVYVFFGEEFCFRFEADDLLGDCKHFC